MFYVTSVLIFLGISATYNRAKVWEAVVVYVGDRLIGRFEQSRPSLWKAMMIYERKG